MPVYESQLTQDGRVTVPAEIQESLGIEPGDVVRFETTAEGVLLLPVTSVVARHFGAAAHSGETLSWREERAAFEEGIASENAVDA